MQQGFVFPVMQFWIAARRQQGIDRFLEIHLYRNGQWRAVSFIGHIGISPCIQQGFDCFKVFGKDSIMQRGLAIIIDRARISPRHQQGGDGLTISFRR